MVEIAIKDLRKSFDGKVAVDGISTFAEEGEFLVLLGPSGCGKTTTLRCIAGLEEPDSGRIEIDGKAVVDVARRVLVRPDRRNIGMVFQSYALWPHMTVFGNVAYPLRTRRFSGSEIRRRVHEALASVGLDGFEDRMATHLSGGQQQRVALARAIVAEPAVLLFDEPLSNLDARLRKELRSELRAFHRRVGTTSVYVTHDQAEALTLGDRVIVMSDGVIVQIGPPRAIYEAPATLDIADFLGFENTVSAVVVGSTGGRIDVRLDGSPCVLSGISPAGIAMQIGERVRVAVRSSSIRLAPSSEGQLVITDSVYMGTYISYSLACAELRMSALIPDVDVDVVGSELGIGATVDLEVNPERLMIYPETARGSTLHE